ncbi:DegT/DnrJ/EryC1/StrS family aminotransferase [Pseudomonas sp. ABC1]|uniref:DegT/DnrJ/EryC1/StrS family aminotransferase n=1 Tax=Pseudomonas sp. ABC1 TaxID=2748080 RepID=UPI0015C3641E|nr:DegT/DnrJ/EryC1/StrS family aminotransferase [Pseudomonas sp. ABC1]QLF92483.1 DegT/DnrJ/EryC1/StrS family aminotransferase [Pseudomonas sp. ABC1]
MKKVIPVTSPLLPPLEEFIPYLEEIWQSRFLTNGGAMHQALEQELCDYLGVEHLSLFANGTLALITALQALRISGEVITTPYSFVATSHALNWNGLKPVFVDIDPVTLNLNPRKIEAAITPQTTAIMPVHCYGNPCATREIQRIADTYNLKVIYDAAHAFGVKDGGGGSILRHGDLSILSFHATKVFNTFEGGAIICPDEKTKQRIDHLKNFGFLDEVTVLMPGINGKLNEVSAAFGLLQLKHIDKALAQRRQIDQLYRSLLANVPGIRCLQAGKEGCSNHAYFPVLVEEGFPLGRDGLYHHLRQHDVLVRRYFYPLISDFPMYSSLPSATAETLPVARAVSARILCLPIYPGLSRQEVESIVEVISGAGR